MTKNRDDMVKGKTLTEWSKELGINRSTLAQRYYVYGWSVDKVLNTPVRKRRFFINPKKK